jgi:dTDP-4-amino-4,6-dideoxygalactose transaminase
MGNKRKKIAEAYTRVFKGISQIQCPVVRKDRQTSWHLYVIKLELDQLKINRADFIKELAKRGVSASVHFIPVYRHPYYRDCFKISPKGFPNSEWLYERIVSLPIYPGLTQKDIQQIISAVRDIVSKFKK